MARIRTIKPEFFRHEGLQDLEAANIGKYPMLAFSGLWAIADREGRFEWRPRRIKLDVLPFLDFSMEETLAILVDAGFVTKYEANGEWFGAINSWDRHQIVGRDEPPSEIPAPDGEMTPYFRPLNQTQRFKVYERDKWVCAYCGRDMKNDHRAACLDHVIPYSKGGTNRDVNLVTSCKKCNSIKSDKTPTEAGFNWPSGLGEYLDRTTNEIRQYAVSPPLTGGAEVPDKEEEREEEEEEEEEEEREEEEEGKKPAASQPPPPKKPRQNKMTISEDFGISDRVMTWASEKGYSRLDEHLEAFKSKCRAKGYKYVDWDEAFMGAIRDDWARLSSSSPGPQRAANRQQALEDANSAALEEWLSGKGRIITGEVLDA